MKKIIPLLLAATLAATFAGCNASSSSEPSTSAASGQSSGDSAGQKTSEPSSQTDSGAADSQTQIIDMNSDEYIQKVKDMYKGEQEYAGLPVVTMETSMGVIKLRLFPEEAPKAVENFLAHAKEGYYDGLTFHRVINNFMIQGGDPKGDGTGGESIWDKPFDIEYSPYLWHFRGCLSMANAGPGSNRSQFFIVQNPSQGMSSDEMSSYGFPPKLMELFAEYGGYPSLDLISPQMNVYGYTKFGYVIEGMDVVDKIAAVAKQGGGESNPNKDMPVEPVTIIKMTVEE